MPKTNILSGYLKKITSLNDQLWYFLFTSEELNRQLSNFTDIAKDNYTIDLFKNNPYSPRIHVKAKNLLKFQRENKNQTFGAYFSTSYEISGYYIQDLFNLLKNFNRLSMYNWDKRKEPEKNLSTLLFQATLPAIQSQIIDTYTYMRLRRNHFTHLSASPNNRLTSFIASNGNVLNTFWRNQGAISHLDFTTASVLEFTQEEIIEMINLLRICLNKIDEHIANILNHNAIIEFVVKREYQGLRTNINHLVLLQRNKKIRRLINSEFGINFTDAHLNPYTSSIGKR